MHRSTPLLLLTLSACKGCQDPVAEPLDLSPVSSDPVGVTVAGFCALFFVITIIRMGMR